MCWPSESGAPGVTRLEPALGRSITWHVIDERRQQLAEGGSADRPPVDEQHVGTGADAPVGDLARADVEVALGLDPEQIGGVSGREGGHGGPLW